VADVHARRHQRAALDADIAELLAQRHAPAPREAGRIEDGDRYLGGADALGEGNHVSVPGGTDEDDRASRPG
jgi:hypothetical protein